MAKNYTRNTFIDALDVLSSAALELHGINTLARERAIESSKQDTIRQEDRAFQRELFDLQKNWQLQYDNVKILAEKDIMLTKEYQDMEDQFEKTYGGLPDISNNALDLLSEQYEGPMDDFAARQSHYQGKMQDILASMDQLEDAESGVIKDAKQYLSDKYPEYWNKEGMPDDILLKEEFDLLVEDYKAEHEGAAVEGLVKGISTYEAGDRTDRTMNPGAILYNANQDWWGHQYGAEFSEEEVFWEFTDDAGKRQQVFTQLAKTEAEDSGYKVTKRSTAVFPTVEKGQEALKHLVTDLISKTGGDYNKLIETYSGAEGETLENYQKAINALDILSMNEIDLGARAMRAEYNAKPYNERVADSRTKQYNKAMVYDDNAKASLMRVQGYFIDPEKSPEGSSYAPEDRKQYKAFKKAFSKEAWKMLTEGPFGRLNVEEYYDYLMEADLDAILWDVAEEFSSFKIDYHYLQQNARMMMDYRYPERTTDIPGLVRDRIFRESDDLGVNIVDYQAMMSSGNIDSDQFNDYMEEFYSQASIKYDTYKGKSAQDYITRYFNDIMSDEGPLDKDKLMLILSEFEEEE